MIEKTPRMPQVSDNVKHPDSLTFEALQKTRVLFSQLPDDFKEQHNLMIAYPNTLQSENFANGSGISIQNLGYTPLRIE